MAWSTDEQIARDMQIALDLQAVEEDIASRRQSNSRASSNVSSEADGCCNGLGADNMLYVPCEVEGKFVEMLVDTGASSSAISKGVMQKLGLQNKLNTRFAGRAVGCGSAAVIGIVENALVSIGHAEFRLFFIVLDTDTPLLILGLDQMRKFKCQIDLEENTLIFGGKGGVEVQFLPRGGNEIINNHQLMEQMRRSGECNVM